MQLENLVRIEDLTPSQVASITDFTFLKTEDAFTGVNDPKNIGAVRAREEAFKGFLNKLKIYHEAGKTPYAVCVRHQDVSYTRYVVDNFNLKDIVITSVVGFPNTHSNIIKIYETDFALKHGAKEIDMVLNYEAFKKGEIDNITSDIRAVTRLVHRNKGILKLILETSELNKDQLVKICNIASTNEVDFIKTSTGYTSQGATIENVKLMRDNFYRGIKLSGQVNSTNYKQLLYAASGRNDGLIDLRPSNVRIGSSSLLSELQSKI